MTDTFALAVLGCFLWGMVSVLFSPCHLASIPLMVGYVAGQGHEIQGREAAGYAGVFSLGLFLSIAVVGVICSLLGRMLGDISPLGGAGGGLAGLARPRPHGRCQVPPAGQDPERIHHAGVSGGLYPGWFLRHFIRGMHIRLHRAHSGHYHRTTESCRRDSLDPVFRFGALPAHCSGGKFRGAESAACGSQRNASCDSMGEKAGRTAGDRHRSVFRRLSIHSLRDFSMRELGGCFLTVRHVPALFLFREKNRFPP